MSFCSALPEIMCDEKDLFFDILVIPFLLMGSR